jgi:hypothetical protein
MFINIAVTADLKRPYGNAMHFQAAINLRLALLLGKISTF